jgi:hypothetical protein
MWFICAGCGVEFTNSSDCECPERTTLKNAVFKARVCVLCRAVCSAGIEHPDPRGVHDGYQEGLAPVLHQSLRQGVEMLLVINGGGAQDNLTQSTKAWLLLQFAE